MFVQTPAGLTRRALLTAAVLACALACSCNNPPTGLVSTQQEIDMGRQAAAQFDAQTPTSEDAAVTRIGMQIARVTPRPDLPWRFRVAETNDVNAFSLPGGFVYIYRGLLNAIHNDPTLIAATLGHECTHVVRRHGVKLMEQQLGAQIGIGALIDLATHGRDPQAIQQIGGVVSTIITEGYSREDEYQADHDGVIYMHRAGYDPNGMVRLLETIQRVAPDSGGGLSKYFESHPGTPSRIERVQQQIARGDV